MRWMLVLGCAVSVASCSLVEPFEAAVTGEEQTIIRARIDYVTGPERARPNEEVTLNLHGNAFAELFVRIDAGRTASGIELLPWQRPGPSGWCATPPLPVFTRYTVRVGGPGPFLVRVLRPDGSAAEHAITVE